MGINEESGLLRNHVKMEASGDSEKSWWRNRKESYKWKGLRWIHESCRRGCNALAQWQLGFHQVEITTGRRSQIWSGSSPVLLSAWILAITTPVWLPLKCHYESLWSQWFHSDFGQVVILEMTSHLIILWGFRLLDFDEVGFISRWTALPRWWTCVTVGSWFSFT